MLLMAYQSDKKLSSQMYKSGYAPSNPKQIASDAAWMREGARLADKHGISPLHKKRCIQGNHGVKH